MYVAVLCPVIVVAICRVERSLLSACVCDCDRDCRAVTTVLLRRSCRCRCDASRRYCLRLQDAVSNLQIFYSLRSVYLGLISFKKRPLHFRISRSRKVTFKFDILSKISRSHDTESSLRAHVFCFNYLCRSLAFQRWPFFPPICSRDILAAITLACLLLSPRARILILFAPVESL